MRKVVIPATLWSHLSEIREYLTVELKLSEKAATARIKRMEDAILSLAHDCDYALCRFKKWRELGYHCTQFDGWVFAYEIFEDGVIVRDMSHAKLLAEVVF